MDKIEAKSDGFYPLEEATLAAQMVCRGDRRKYYRFRPAKFYGGIATADCLGCCLRCLFCWSWPKANSPGRYGRFYSPAQVADKLAHIALKKGFHQRICLKVQFQIKKSRLTRKTVSVIRLGNGSVELKPQHIGPKLMPAHNA
jgi:uncharacterized Fe-S cluster-containing radical SAM superfamily protein